MATDVTVFTLDSLIGSQREYIEWLVSQCTTEGTQIGDILEAEATDLLATRLKTPLQLEQHLTLALEAGVPLRRKASYNSDC